ncbi:MAG: ATP-binding cassette domain-containing protein [Deltaproteobacteria bacterium]|nr:ATP-binding cassette domain-containing protein [Deltaproteobacteria bacterium]
MGSIRSETTHGYESLSGSRKDKDVVLRAEELRKAFGGQVVLNGLSLTLRRGEVVILRGDNGSGKTTLLNILTGNLEPDNGSIFLFTDGIAETFRFPRPWWRNLATHATLLLAELAQQHFRRCTETVGRKSFMDSLTPSQCEKAGRAPVQPN